MATYHFNVRHHHRLVVDHEGDNFRFFGEALDEAAIQGPVLARRA